jgi:hypothetical protein
MPQSAEQIAQAMRSLETQATELGEQLHRAHQSYRNVLAQTASQQLIMACFTLCTEAYPKEFLALSVPARQKLQDKIRHLSRQLQDNLNDVPRPSDTLSNPPTTPAPIAALSSLFSRPPAAADDVETEDDGLEAIVIESDDQNEPPPIGILDSEALQAALGDALNDALNHAFGEEEEEETETDDDRPKPPPSDLKSDRGFTIEDELRALFSMDGLRRKTLAIPKNPVEQVGFWQEQVEEQTRRYLRQISSEVNQTLQREGILPKQLPAAILEAASLADGGDPFGKTPHLMRMVLEARERKPSKSRRLGKRSRLEEEEEEDDGFQPIADRDEETKRPPAAVMQVVALQLRLTELEFHDTNLIPRRNRIRELLKSLKSLTKDYQKKQREHAIAEAQLAWKSTWTP